MSIDVPRYVKGLLLLALLIPIHELLHAATCVGLGGSLLHFNPFSHAVCGGNINTMSTYTFLNGTNQFLTAILFMYQMSRIHVFYVFSPILARTF